MKMLLSKLSYLCVIGISLLTACNKESSVVNYMDIDNVIITDYIKANNLNADSTSSGLYYVVQKQGTGAAPKVYSDVSVSYKGTFTDGSVFDEAINPIKFNLGQVIPGWTEGIQLFNEGGEGILLIPSYLGYGSSARPGIPANSVLIFEIKLVTVY